MSDDEAHSDHTDQKYAEHGPGCDGTKVFAASSASRATARQDELVAMVRRAGIYIIALCVFFPPVVVAALGAVAGIVYLVVRRFRARH